MLPGSEANVALKHNNVLFQSTWQARGIVFCQCLLAEHTFALKPGSSKGCFWKLSGPKDKYTQIVSQCSNGCANIAEKMLRIKVKGSVCEKPFSSYLK
jgi:hypothetical protein